MVLNLLVLDLSSKNVTRIVIRIVNNIDMLFVKLVGIYKKINRTSIYDIGIVIYGKSFHFPGISSVVFISKIINCVIIRAVIAIIDNHPNIENKAEYQFCHNINDM